MRIGYALGGGGARGGAHIGALMALQEEGIQPDIIVGCSIGGLVGVMLATGMTFDEMKAVFNQLDLRRLFVFGGGGGTALTHNTNFRKLLQDIFGNLAFEDLEMPISVVATDILTRRMVIIDSGHVVPALLATTAIPLVLPPVAHQGHLLLDGGLLNTTPFDVVRAQGADIVIAVDLTKRSKAEPGITEDTQGNNLAILMNRLFGRSIASPPRIISLMMDIHTETEVNLRMITSPPDVILQPDVSMLEMLAFDRWEEGVPAGYAAVQQNLAVLHDVLEERRRHEMLMTPEDDKTVIANLNKLVRHMIDLREISTMTASRLNPQDRAIFTVLAEQSELVIQVLSDIIQQLDGQPIKSGSLPGDLWRSLMGVGTDISGSVQLIRNAVIEQLNTTIKAYETVLTLELSVVLLAKLRGHRDVMRQFVDDISNG